MKKGARSGWLSHVTAKVVLAVYRLLRAKFLRIMPHQVLRCEKAVPRLLINQYDVSVYFHHYYIKLQYVCTSSKEEG